MDIYSTPKTLTDEPQNTELSKKEQLSRYYVLLFSVLFVGYMIIDFIDSYLYLGSLEDTSTYLNAWLMAYGIFPLIYLLVLIGLIRRKRYGKYGFILLSFLFYSVIVYQVYSQGFNEWVISYMDHYTNIILTTAMIVANIACLIILLSPLGGKAFGKK